MFPERHWGGLIWTLVRTDFKTRYHGTLGGFLWALLKPATMFLVLLGVFSLVFATDPVYKQNLLLGLFLWDYFAEATKAGIVSMHTKGYLLTKSQLPPWIVIVTSTSNALITLVVFCCVMLVFLIVAGGGVTPGGVALFLCYVGALALIVTGISLAGAVLFLRYRDLNQIWEVAIHAGFFLAPVIYPLSIIPERYHYYLYLWPPTPVIQFSRSVLVEQKTPTAIAHASLAVLIAVVLALGVTTYRRFARRAVEHL